MYKATEEQISEWKEKYGDVFGITVEEKACYLKKPNRKILGYAMVAGKDNPVKFNEALLRDCWLDGDGEIKTNDDLFFAASSILGEIIKAKEAELVKL
jgi:hypothetical protein